jgi:hypothetical protein
MLHLTFQVVVFAKREVVNADYSVRSAEGATASGEPVVTRVLFTPRNVYLPITSKN